MAIEKFCATHWATMPHEAEAPYPADGETCSFCNRPAARAAGHEPEPVPRGQLEESARAAWSLPSDAALESKQLPAEPVIAMPEPDPFKRVPRRSERP